MSLLCVAVDNTQTLVGVYDGPVLTRRWQLATDPRRTADDWWLTIDALLSGAGVEVDGVGISSAVPAASSALRALAARAWDDVPVVVFGAGVRTGLPMRADNPRDLGTDRVANAVGALDLVGAPCVAVGIGTATTFDVVDATGTYVGGAIASGIETSLAALGMSAAQLRQVELALPRSVIARSTVEALQSGALYGAAGLVDGIVARIADELGLDADRLPVVATGCHAALLVDICERITRHEPDLTLHGIRLVFDRNDPRDVVA